MNRGVEWDYTDDFTTDKMTYSGSSYAYDGVGNEQDFTISNSLSADQSYVDMLGANVSDTLWELRYLRKITSFTGNTTGTIKASYAGLFSTTSGMTTAQDGIYSILYTTDSPINDYYRIGTSNDSAPNVSGSDALTTKLGVDDVYEALLRTSSTSSKVSLSSADTYTEDIETKTDVVASTCQSLRYLQHSNRSGNVNGTVTGNFDDVFFKDGVNYL